MEVAWYVYLYLVAINSPAQVVCVCVSSFSTVIKANSPGTTGEPQLLPVVAARGVQGLEGGAAKPTEPPGEGELQLARQLGGRGATLWQAAIFFLSATASHCAECCRQRPRTPLRRCWGWRRHHVNRSFGLRGAAHICSHGLKHHTQL